MNEKEMERDVFYTQMVVLDQREVRWRTGGGGRSAREINKG